jgi:hypothetical protein
MPNYNPDFEGKKTLGSKLLYEQRKYYKEKVSSIYNSFNSNYIDLWYETPFYGKANSKGKLRLPKKEFLKYSAGDNLVAFEFVKQAFNEFKFYMMRGLSQGRSDLSKLFGDFEVKVSFEDSELRYLRYTLSLLNILNERIINSGALITNPKQYITELFKYLNDVKGALFSFYSFFSSNLTTVKASGLAINLRIMDYDDDFNKNAFFKNDEFYKYVQAAANFGFRIDKNAPWMLIADLNSKPMKEGHKIQRNGEINEVSGYMLQNMPDPIVSVDYLFDNFYDRVIDKSLDLLKLNLYEGYSKYQKKMLFLIDSGQIVSHPKHTFKNVGSMAISRKQERVLEIKPYTFAEFTKEYSDCFFLRTLEKMLMTEYKTVNNFNYRAFKKKFLSTTKTDTKKSLDMLEIFYNPTKIFNPATKKPMWVESGNYPLTSENSNIMIPNEKQKPTVGKTVTEFYTGF